MKSSSTKPLSKRAQRKLAMSKVDTKQPSVQERKIPVSSPPSMKAGASSSRGQEINKIVPIGTSSLPLSDRLVGNFQTIAGAVVSGHRERVHGREFITNVVAGAVVTAGSIVVSKPNVCNPLSTRLERFASLYERWRPLRYRWRFIPTQPATFAGTLVFASDPDVSATYDSLDTNLVRLMALEGAQVTQVWQATDSDLSPNGDYTSLWTLDPNPLTTTVEDRLIRAGNFLVAIASTGNIVTGTSLGILELEYDIEFYSPKISPVGVSDTPGWFNMTLASFGNMLAGIATPNVVAALLNVVQNTNVGSYGSQFAGYMKILRDFSAYVLPVYDRDRVPRGLTLGSEFKGHIDKSVNYHSPYVEEETGLPRGKYQFDIALVSESSDDKDKTVYITSGVQLRATNHGIVNTPIQFRDQAYKGPNGVTYPTSVQHSFNVNISSFTRGFADELWGTPPPVALIGPVHVFTRFYSHASTIEIPFDIDPFGNGTSGRPRDCPSFDVDDPPELPVMVTPPKLSSKPVVATTTVPSTSSSSSEDRARLKR